MELLIFGQKDDPHVERVSNHWLDKRIGSIKIVNQWVMTPCAISIDNSKTSISIEGECLKLESPRLVWWRVKPNFGSIKLEFEDHIHERYWKSQWQMFQKSLELLAPSTRCINPLPAREIAALKPIQLAAAREAGLTIPSTVIGNDPATLHALGNDIFFKHLTSHLVRDGHANHTARYSGDELQSKSSLISAAPGIFQIYNSKIYEIRACVFGDQVHAFRIDSQRFAATREYWRRMPLPDYSIDVAEISESEKLSLILILKKLNLHYGIFDLIREPSGKLVFLEVNSDGQWGWLERATGKDISGSFVDSLIDFA